MMEKRFTFLSEIKDERLQEKFRDFSALNKVIEENQITREQLFEAYSNVLTGEFSIEHTDELHYQIKYLIEEVKVAINSILEFYDKKYTPERDSYIKHSIELINQLFYLPNEARNAILDFLESDDINAQLGLIIFTDGTENEPKEYLLSKKDTSKHIYESIHRWNKKALNSGGMIGVREFME